MGGRVFPLHPPQLGDGDSVWRGMDGGVGMRRRRTKHHLRFRRHRQSGMGLWFGVRTPRHGSLSGEISLWSLC